MPQNMIPSLIFSINLPKLACTAPKCIILSTNKVRCMYLAFKGVNDEDA